MDDGWMIGRWIDEGGILKAHFCQQDPTYFFLCDLFLFVFR